MGSIRNLSVKYILIKSIMGFGDLNKDAGLKVLNTFLEDKSYVDGYVPSQADVVVFKAMSGSPDEKFVHALRWFLHMTSYKSSFTSLPGVAQSLDKYGPSGVAAAAEESDDDDSDDLFGSDDEEDTAGQERIKAERIAAYNERKAGKKKVAAKSSILLDVKPWDDETNMAEVESNVRTIECDGLLWGASKLVPIGYGIKKLQINCVIEDDKVSTDFLEESITAFEDHVQSVDIAAFNKI